jgi:hypothetical protein
MQKLLFSRLAGLFLFLSLAMATGCSPFKGLFTRKPTAEQELSTVLAAHPELLKPDTISVAVPVRVPEVRFEKELVQVHDTVYVQQERAELDTLIEHLQTSLDTAQATAVKGKLHQLLLQRPVLRDTLCFDTLGISGKIWLKGRNYKLQLIRAAIADTARTRVVTGRLAACPELERFHLFRPATWGFPWYVWLLIGAALGAWLLSGIVSLVAGRRNA